MALAALKTKIDIDDYLEGEEISPIRYEYLHGEVYAMAGTSQNHNRIVRNTLNALSRHLSQSPCEPYAENIKVRTSEEIFYYPDLIVTCEGEFSNQYFCESPLLIIEVTSSSTLRVDKLEKLVAYQAMPSVLEVVLIDQYEIAVEIHRKQSDETWVTHYFGEKDREFTLESVDLTLQIADVYARVSFVAEPSDENLF